MRDDGFVPTAGEPEAAAPRRTASRVHPLQDLCLPIHGGATGFGPAISRSSSVSSDPGSEVSGWAPPKHHSKPRLQAPKPELGRRQSLQYSKLLADSGTEDGEAGDKRLSRTSSRSSAGSIHSSLLRPSFDGLPSLSRNSSASSGQLSSALRRSSESNSASITATMNLPTPSPGQAGEDSTDGFGLKSFLRLMGSYIRPSFTGATAPSPGPHSFSSSASQSLVSQEAQAMRMGVPLSFWTSNSERSPALPFMHLGLGSFFNDSPPVAAQADPLMGLPSSGEPSQPPAPTAGTLRGTRGPGGLPARLTNFATARPSTSSTVPPSPRSGPQEASAAVKPARALPGLTVDTSRATVAPRAREGWGRPPLADSPSGRGSKRSSKRGSDAIPTGSSNAASTPTGSALASSNPGAGRPRRSDKRPGWVQGIQQCSLHGNGNSSSSRASRGSVVQQQREEENSGEGQSPEPMELDEVSLLPIDGGVKEGPPPSPPLWMRTGHRRKTLVLDLDETLVHSTFAPPAKVKADYILPLNMDGRQMHVYVVKRPGVHQFLEAMARMYEVVLFTASMPRYANPLLDRLDPTRQLIHHRLFRDACSLPSPQAAAPTYGTQPVHQTGGFVKDLSRLGRDLRSTILVDNSPQSFLWQPENGLLVPSFFDDLSDTVLLQLIPFFTAIAATQGDVRPLLRAGLAGYNSGAPAAGAEHQGCANAGEATRSTGAGGGRLVSSP